MSKQTQWWIAVAMFGVVATTFFGSAVAQFNVSPGPLAIGGPLAPAAPAATTEGFLDVGQAFSAAVQPYINAAIQALLTAGLAYLGWILKKKFDINISEGQRDALQTWLTNQAGSLIADGKVTVADGKVTVNKDALDAHAHQFAAQIPDAVKFFGITPETLAAKIVDKIPQTAAGAQLIAQSAAPASPPAPPPAPPQ